MKRFISSLICLILFVVVSVAQTIPQTMSYQAVVRNAQGELVVNKQLSVTISVIKTNELGDVVYSETQSVQTNANGLMTLQIGNGEHFSEIVWADGPYFLKTEINIDGGVIESVSQLLAVPYAKYAEMAGNMDEYVKKSEIDSYIENKVRSMFKEAFERASQLTDDSTEILEETIKDVTGESGGDKSFFMGSDTSSLLGVISDSGGWLYDYLSSDPNNWKGLGSVVVGLAGVVYGQDALDELMKENLASDYSKWENSAKKWYGGGQSTLRDSVAAWTVEDYGTWSEIARNPSCLGNDKVNEILTNLLQEDWDSYSQYACQLDDCGASIYSGISNQGVNQDGSVEGVFKISETESVKFSKGNLQYQASTNTWRFAEYQFDAVSGKSNNHVGENGGNVFVNNVKSDNVNVSSTYSGWIDLFAWGCSGHKVADEEYSAYLPYSLNEDCSDYYQGATLTGTSADWGVNMSTGTTTWRTLSKTEWDYLYQHSKSKGHFAYATINTKKGDETIPVAGIVLLPENWSGMPGNCTFNSEENFNANTYSESQWFKMQKKGAVFFPASGVRKISDKSSKANKVWLTSTMTYAAYWTADATQNSANAFWFVGSSDKGVQQQPYSKNAGMCVRLVKVVQ